MMDKHSPVGVSSSLSTLDTMRDEEDGRISVPTFGERSPSISTARPCPVMSMGKLKPLVERKSVSHTRVIDDSTISETYKIGKLLGQGSFGKVYEATNRLTGEIWAVKSINKEKAGSAAMKLVEREVAILKKVDHEHIIHLNEVLESPRKMYLVMEICCGGELAEVLKSRTSLDESIVRQIMSNLASAIAYLHKNDIVHRDLKLENILLHNNPEEEGEEWDIKVTDFGLSIVKGGQGQDNMMQAFCGTPIYMAPEILDNKTYSRQCDIWALGVLMYILLTGYPPFNASDDEKLYELIKQAKVYFADDLWDNISDEAKSCVHGMLTLDPAHRLTAVEVTQHVFITGKKKGTKNVLEMMKQYNKEMRNGENESDINLVGSDEKLTADDRLTVPGTSDRISKPNSPPNTSALPERSKSACDKTKRLSPLSMSLGGALTTGNASSPTDRTLKHTTTDKYGTKGREKTHDNTLSITDKKSSIRGSPKPTSAQRASFASTGSHVSGNPSSTKARSPFQSIPSSSTHQRNSVAASMPSRHPTSSRSTSKTKKK